MDINQFRQSRELSLMFNVDIFSFVIRYMLIRRWVHGIFVSSFEMPSIISCAVTFGVRVGQVLRRSGLPCQMLFDAALGLYTVKYRQRCVSYCLMMSLYSSVFLRYSMILVMAEMKGQCSSLRFCSLLHTKTLQFII